MECDRRAAMSDVARAYDTRPSLLAWVQQSEPLAWDRLVYLYTPLVHHVARRWQVVGADAVDVLQEVFLAVAAGIDHYSRTLAGTPGAFRRWLGGIIRHK